MYRHGHQLDGSQRWRCAITHKKKEREGWIRRKYGLTVKQYEVILSQPCAICGKDSQHLDHSHLSGANRKALCGTCNQGIGLFFDSPELLVRAAEYVETHR
jgi:hypothetical protein